MASHYRVVFRDETEVPQGIVADVVNGWKGDYAFMDVDGGVKCLIPREIVRSVERMQMLAEKPPLADAEKHAYEWWNALHPESKAAIAGCHPDLTQLWWEGLSARERVCEHKMIVDRPHDEELQAIPSVRVCKGCARPEWQILRDGHDPICPESPNNPQQT